MYVPDPLKCPKSPSKSVVMGPYSRKHIANAKSGFLRAAGVTRSTIPTGSATGDVLSIALSALQPNVKERRATKCPILSADVIARPSSALRSTERHCMIRRQVPWHASNLLRSHAHESIYKHRLRKLSDLHHREAGIQISGAATRK